MWFMLVGDDPEVAELVRIGQDRLAGLGGLDLVPREWLHMTTLIAGFSDEITADQVDLMTDHARQLLACIPPDTHHAGASPVPPPGGHARCAAA